MRVAPGETLSEGRYQLERVLGTGGMASVWLARDEQLDRPVAIKVIADTLALDDAYVARFAREARLAARLTHPNLVKIYDFAAEAERPYLVMEFVPGSTLAQVDGGTYRDAETLARDLLQALDHIHRAGVIHRDVKPANVLMGSDGRPRLTDFGIAHPADATRLTRTGQVIGTARYMAPEVARGEPATPGSDLYALGVMLAEVAAPAARRRLAPLIDSLTAADPASRPESAGAAAALLGDPTAPTHARPAAPAAAKPPPPPPPRTAPTGVTRVIHRRSRGALGIAAALLALVAVVVVVAVSSGGKSRAPSASPAAPAPPGAPLGRQLDALDRAVRAAPSR